MLIIYLFISDQFPQHSVAAKQSGQEDAESVKLLCKVIRFR